MVLNKLSAKVEIEIKNGNGDLLGARLQAAYLCWRQLLQQRSDGGASLNLLKMHGLKQTHRREGDRESSKVVVRVKLAIR